MTTHHLSPHAIRTTTAPVMTTLLALILTAAIAVGYVDLALAADGAWVRQTTGTTKQLNAVFFVDQTTGWAVGNDATVLHTVDAGATWVAQSVPVSSNYDLTGVDFVNPMTGWMAADGPDLKVLRTTDGGATWAAATLSNVSSVFPNLNDVDFVDADHGLAGGNWANTNFNRTYDLSISGDGGGAWANIDFAEFILGEPYISDIEWADASSVWACGDTATSELALIHSNGGGTGWVQVNTRVAYGGGEPFGALREVDFFDAVHGWAISDFVIDSVSGNGAVLLYTSDGGAGGWQHRHWSEMGLGAADRPNAIDFVDLSHGWMAAGPSRNTWHTTNGGSTWQSVVVPESTILTDIDFVTDSCGWAVGWDGKIFHYAVPTAPIDTTPPTSTASGYDAKWHKGPVSVALSAADNAGGSGVDYTEYKVDSGSWTRGSQVTITASARGANDGIHTISYRSADKAAPANLEVVQTCQVKIDTVGPVCKAKNVRVKRGKFCKLLFCVGDTRSEQVTTVIRIKTSRGVTKKTFSWGYDKANSWWTVKYKASLKKGTYRYYVYGNDLAGNKQSVVGRAKLTVK